MVNRNIEKCMESISFYCISFRNGPFSHLNQKKMLKAVSVVFLSLRYPTSVFYDNFRQLEQFFGLWVLELTDVECIKFSSFSIAALLASSYTCSVILTERWWIEFLIYRSDVLEWI